VNDVEQIVSRPVTRGDYESIVQLLRQSVGQSPIGHNWDIRRWEGTCWYHHAEGGNPAWHEQCRLWQGDTGRPVGLVHLDGPGYPYLEIHPGYRHLEPEMIEWIEENLADTASADGIPSSLRFFVFDYDSHRRRILTERGYEQTNRGGVTRHLRLGRQPAARALLPAGYVLRETQPEDLRDAGQIADLLNAGFGRTFHTALEYQRFTRRATCFHRELDLVAVAPDGDFAAYVGVPYDEETRRAVFEPVCTHPEHRRRGLAKALMQEGLVRLRGRGASSVIVETGDRLPANRLYESIGFTEAYRGSFWQRDPPGD
jgi:mycothiol synthase